MTVGRVLLAGTGPPAFVLRSRCGPARVAFEVVDKLSEHVEMVAWLVGVARRRRAWRIHWDFVLQIMRKIPGCRVPRASHAAPHRAAAGTCVAQSDSRGRNQRVQEQI